MDKLISVIIPVYNVEKYLRQCVDSVLNQTYKNTEIILVDDGSPDNCPRICEEYSMQNEKIKTIHKENAGLGMARNTGLEYVTGKYVTFLDSDDFWDCDFIERLVKELEKEQADTVKTVFRRVDEYSEFLIEENVQYKVYSSDLKTTFLPRLIGSDVETKDSLPMSACCTLYSVDLIKENEILFPSEREWISEDLIFNIEYFLHSKKVVLSDYIGYNYRTNQKSLSKTYRKERFDMCKALYFKEREMLQDIGLWKVCEYRLSRQFFVYLRMCISQLCASDLTKKMKKMCLKKMCNDEFVVNQIRTYPISKLQLKPKVFLFLVKNKMYCVLMLLAKLKFM